VAEAVLMFPHTGGPQQVRRSSYLRARLHRGRRYRLRVEEGPYSVNMSAFAHFEAYTGGDGGAAPVNQAGIRGVELLTW
jgi:hypothetical protein